MDWMRRAVASAALAAALAPLAAPAGAQTAPAAPAAWPARPITMVIPFPVGGSTDVLGRVLAATMARSLGQNVVVENAGGAGGTVGAARVARAAPDGYTILFHNFAHATAPALYRSLPYDPIASFEPVGLVVDVPMVLVARKDFPPATFRDAVPYLKANRDKIMFANAGIGATSHMCGMLLQAALQVDMTTVPFRGTGPALNDLIGGQVDLLCDQPASTAGHIASGAVKPLAVATRARIKSLPEVPTFAESGLKDFELAVWHAFYVPRSTPRAVVDRIGQALREALKDAALRDRFAPLGAEPVEPERATPEALRTYLKAEVDRWGPLVRKAGVYAD